MDFDLDDPLGDLLSDGSNDSFFGTSKKTEPKKSTKSASQPTSDAKSKSKVADLFGIDSEITEKPIETEFKANLSATQRRTSSELKKSTNKEESSVGQQQSVKPSTPSRVTSSTTPTRDAIGKAAMEPKKRETRFDDSDDFLNELGFDPKHPKGSMTSAKKSNILDDILNFSRSDPVANATTTAIAAPKPVLSDADKKVSKPAESNPSTNRYSPSLGRTRNLPRSGSGGSIGDPLGLFSKQEPKKEEVAITSTRSKSKKSAVDWLGLDAENDTKPETIFPIANEAKPEKPIQNTTIEPTNIPAANIPSTNLPANVPAVPTANVAAADLSTSLNLINRAALEKEQALQSLQHQETQLRIATQMKQQENMLHDMQSKQQTLIKQQENQFNQLLRRQIDRQNQLETQIHQQQEQINAYIGVLMNQPSIGMVGTIKMPDNDDSAEPRQSDGETSHREHFIELEADVKRLELEKLRLEDTLQSIQTAHEQELELLHTSHK